VLLALQNHNQTTSDSTAMKTPRLISSTLSAAALSLAFIVPAGLRAADHRDGPTFGPPTRFDVADVYAFLDPRDNDKVVLIGTIGGFIVPGEAVNEGAFDSTGLFSFAIENDGDARADMFIDVRFSRRAIREGASSPSQDAFVSFRNESRRVLRCPQGVFSAPVTQPTLNEVANPQIVTELANEEHPAPDIQFFAGEVDDPFFFDIPGFSRFVGSVLAGSPDPSRLNRGRDTFAGYNIVAIALRVPATMLRDATPKAGTVAPTKIGVSFTTAQGNVQTVRGERVSLGRWHQLDRMGIPGVNVAFIGFNRKEAYNSASTQDDANGVFFDDIAGTLAALGTNAANTALLASIVGLPPAKPLKKSDPRGTGDFLRLETDKALLPNDGLGGPSSNANGFPNGRRLADDVIDTVLSLVTNGAITGGDHVNANDVLFQPAFPFLALPQQPREGTGNVEDNTRN
jgi:Domain of unknown function (DUF4331)